MFYFLYKVCVFKMIYLQHGRLNFTGRGPQLLLWASLWATHIKITRSGTHNCPKLLCNSIVPQHMWPQSA